PLDRGVQKLRIGWEGDVLGLHGGIDRDPRQILRPQRPALVRHPQALGQEKFQLAAEALAPMAQVRALVRKLVLEELLSSEVLEVWIIDPAFAHAFVGQSVNMLEKKARSQTVSQFQAGHRRCTAARSRRRRTPSRSCPRAALKHVPSQLNQGDSLRAKDERVYRH